MKTAIFLWFSYGFPMNTSIFLWFSYGFPMKTSIFQPLLICFGLRFSQVREHFVVFELPREGAIVQARGQRRKAG
jgi:hypothetical protein